MKSRTVLILSAVLVIVFIIFIIVAVREPSQPISDFEREGFFSGQASSASLEFLRILQNLQKIDFEEASIFQSDGFKNLVDFTVPIEPQEVGRSNPFAPVNPEEVFE